MANSSSLYRTNLARRLHPFLGCILLLTGGFAAAQPAAPLMAMSGTAMACPDPASWRTQFGDSIVSLSKPLGLPAVNPGEIPAEIIHNFRSAVFGSGFSTPESDSDVALINAEVAAQRNLVNCPDAPVSPDLAALHKDTLAYIQMHLPDVAE